MFTPNWSFSISDYLQMIVIEAALIGPLVIDRISRTIDKPEITLIVMDDDISWFQINESVSDNVILIDKRNPGGKRINKYQKFVYRIKIMNSEKTMLEKGEVIIKSIQYSSSLPDKETSNESMSDKKPIEILDDFSLTWPGTENIYKNINPGRKVYFDLFHVVSFKYEQALTDNNIFFDPNYRRADGFRFSGRTELGGLYLLKDPGFYLITLTVYASNIESKDFQILVHYKEDWEKDLSILEISKKFHVSKLN